MTATEPTGTAAPPTRRERQRAATMDEIVQVSRRLLVDPQGISLRSIAAEMGMTAPALYRYVDSYDDLIFRVAADVYDDILTALESARDRYPDDDPAARIVAASAAFRQWSLAHRSEFSLIFTNTATDVRTSGAAVCAEAGQRFGALFSELFIQLWREYQFDVLGEAEFDPALVEQLVAGDARHSDFHPAWSNRGVPVGLQWVFLRTWSRLYGTVTLEVYEHVDATIVGSGALFRDMIAGLGRELALGPQEARLRAVLDAELAR